MGISPLRSVLASQKMAGFGSRGLELGDCMNGSSHIADVHPQCSASEEMNLGNVSTESSPSTVPRDHFLRSAV